MELAETKVLEPIEQMIDRLGVSSVFGEPYKEGDTTVIPVASVTVGFGYGYGGGPGAATGGEDTEAGEPAAEPSETAGGAGGGAGGSAKPQGYLRITPNDATYEPIVDQSKIAIAGIFMSAWSVFWIARAIRSLAKS